MKKPFHREYPWLFIDIQNSILDVLFNYGIHNFGIHNLVIDNIHNWKVDIHIWIWISIIRDNYGYLCLLWISMTQLWISIFGYEYLEFTTIVDIHNSVMETIMDILLVLVLILNPLLDFFFLVYQADVSIFYTSNLYWWGKGWPVDGLPFPDTGCPVPDVSIYYMSNINESPDGILFHWFCKCTPPWMFLPLDIPSEYRPEHVTFGLLCVIFKFPSRIFCRRVPGFATDCPCGVWCRGLTTCLLYVGPPLEF